MKNAWNKVKAFFGTETVTIKTGWVFLAAVAFFVLLGIAINK